jgi:hypothetical protein
LGPPDQRFALHLVPFLLTLAEPHSHPGFPPAHLHSSLEAKYYNQHLGSLPLQYRRDDIDISPDIMTGRFASHPWRMPQLFCGERFCNVFARLGLQGMS